MFFDTHECTSDEVTADMYNQGSLHICLPTKKIKLSNNFMFFPYTGVKLVVQPNYDTIKDKKVVNAEVNNFGLSRLQVNSEVNLEITDGRPVK